MKSITIILLIIFHSTLFGGIFGDIFTDHEKLAIEARVIEAFEKADFKAAKKAVRDLRSKTGNYDSYDEVLKAMEYFAFLRKEADKFEKSKPNSGFIWVENYYSLYCKRFSELKGVPSNIVNIVNQQRREAVEIYNNAVEIENKRRKEFATEKVRIEEERLSLIAKHKEEQRKLKEERRQQVIKRQEEQRQRVIELQQQQEQRLLATANRKEEQVKSLNSYVNDLGYNGFKSTNLIEFIYETQQEGNLGDFMNTVIGSIDEDRDSNLDANRQIKILQIIDDKSLYTFTHYYCGALFQLAVMIKNDPNKIYQEGQSLQDCYLVFKGMVEYITAIGGTKTVPYFERVKVIKN